MAPALDNKEQLLLIEEIYLPFLKKLIKQLDSKGRKPKNYEKIRQIYNVFAKDNDKEKVKLYVSNKVMLDKLHQNYKAEMKNKKANDAQSASDDSQHSSASSPSASGSADDGTSSSKLDIGDVKQQADGMYMKGATKPSAVLERTPKQSTNEANESKRKVPARDSDGNIIFNCGSCEYSNIDEAVFTKHIQTEHRGDLSMWCKRCGRCYGNCSNLCSHIKDECEELCMIYRCGVKACTFETPNGQTFVQHLRHCHKGSGFIYCVQCQKIFTMPHCLVMHMQQECVFKDKNRVDNSATKSSTSLPTEQKSADQKSKTVSKDEDGTHEADDTKVGQNVTDQKRKRKHVATGGRKGRPQQKKIHSGNDSDDDPDDPDGLEDLIDNHSRVEGRSARKFACSSSSCDFVASSKYLLSKHVANEHGD